MGGIVQGIGSIVGGIMASDTAGDAQTAMLNAQNDAVNMINSIGAGPDLAREIFLEKYQQAGVLTPELEQQVNAKFGQIAPVSQGVTAAQKQALAQLSNISKTGVTAEDRLALNKLQTQTARDNAAQQNSIIQNMAARGQAGGGAELAARLMASQAGANQEAQGGLQIAANAQQRALQALGAMGSQAGQMRGQEFNENQANTNIANEQQRFNINNQLSQQQRNVAAKNNSQQYNLQNQQNIMNANTQMGNAERQRQRQAEQQMYTNKANQAKAAAAARVGQGSAQLSAGYDNAAMQAGMGTAIGQMGAGVAGMFNQGGGNTTGGNEGFMSYDPYNSGGGGQDYTQGMNSGGDRTGGASEFNQGGYIPGQGPQDYTKGGEVPGHARVPGDSPENDTVKARLSPGELVIPRSIAHSPDKAKKFIDLVHAEEEKYPHMFGKKAYADGGYTQPGAFPGPLSPELMQEYNKYPSLTPQDAQGIINNFNAMPASDQVAAGTDNSASLSQMPGQFPMNPAQQEAGRAFGLGALTPEQSQYKAQLSDDPASEYPSNYPAGAPLKEMTAKELKEQEAKDAAEKDAKEGVELPDVKEKEPEAPSEEAKATESDSSQEPKSLDDYVASLKQSKAGESSPDYLAQLKEAYGKMQQGQNQAMIARGAERFASAAGRIKPDYSGAEALEKQAGQPVQLLEQGIKIQDAGQKLEFNKKMADPNSKISKIFQDSIVKANPGLKDAVEGTSAEQLAKIFPQLVSMHKADVLQEAKAGVNDSKAKDKVNQVVKNSRLELEKHKANLTEMDKAKSLVEDAIKNPSAIADIASFYASAKAFNPKAIVRSGNVALEQRAIPVITRIENNIKGILPNGKPRLSDPGVQKDMLKSIEILRGIAEEDHKLYQGSVLKAAKSSGVPEDRFDEIVPGYGSAPKSEGSVSFRRKSDGKVAKIPADRADAFANNADFERVD